MSDVLERLRSKEETLRNLQTQEDRRQGREEQLLKQLQEEFKVGTLEEAETLLKTLTAQHTECEDKLEAIDAELKQIIDSARPESVEGQQCGSSS